MFVKSPSVVANSDQQLIRSCREGNPSAWQRLLNKYERLVYSIPLRYGLSHDDAADITQTTFTILIQSLGSLPESSRLSSWLATVARRHTAARLRASVWTAQTSLRTLCFSAGATPTP